MSRIAQAFERSSRERRKALLAYVCGGDPSLEATERAVVRLAAAGADLVEIGVPFSDPIADGPTIAQAAQRALEAGTTPEAVMGAVARIRLGGCQVPIVLMTYLNPVMSRDVGRFCADAAAAGVDGLIIPDLPVDEAGPVGQRAAQHGLDLVLLAAPNTPPERVELIAARTRGFLYFVSVTGVTGARAELPPELPALLAAARKVSRVPVCVGFGISTPEQAQALAPHADGLVVGSALVRSLFDAKGDTAPAEALVRSLAAALRSGA